MADLTPLGFNPAEVEDLGDGFKVLPPGIYTVIIVDSKVADTKSGDGKMLLLTYQIIEGKNISDTVLDRLNILNPSPKAQAIGLSQLKNICDAVGHVGNLADSDILHGKPLSVKIGIEPFTNNEGKVLESNRVEKRMKKQAAQQGEMPPPPEAASQSAASGEQASMPWG